MGVACSTQGVEKLFNDNIDTTMLYNYNKKQLFQPETAAGFFIQTLQIMQKQKKYTNSQVVEDSYMKQQIYTNPLVENVVQIKEDHIIDDYHKYYEDNIKNTNEEQNFEFQASCSDQFQELDTNASGILEPPPMDQKARKFDVDLFKTLYTKQKLIINKLPFQMVVSLIQHMYPYISEFDIYCTLFYIDYQQQQPGSVYFIKQQFELYKQNKPNQVVLQDTLYDCQQFISLAYILSPDAVKRFSQAPMYVLFFASDQFYNGYVKLKDLLVLVQKHCGMYVRNKLFAQLKGFGQIISLQDFDFGYVQTEFSNIQDCFLNYDVYQVRKFIKEYRKRIKKNKKFLVQQIEDFMKKIKINSTTDRHVMKLMTDHEMEKDADRWLQGLLEIESSNEENNKKNSDSEEPSK